MFLYIFSFREGKFVLLNPIALNWFTFKFSLHSLHGYHKQQNINYFPCNVLVFLMSLMSLDISISFEKLYINTVYSLEKVY